METVTLKARVRTKSGKGVSRRLRAGGEIPVVAYGRGKDSLTLTISSDALRDILRSKRGSNTIIDLDVEGGSNDVVMVKEFTIHPLSRKLMHADFIRIDDTTRVDVSVPFHAVGRSKGETLGGTLLVTTRSLKLRCMPYAIPTSIDYDVSGLDVNDLVRVADLELPEGVEPLMAPDRKVVSVAPPRVEAAPEEAEGEEGEAAEGAEGEADAAED